MSLLKRNQALIRILFQPHESLNEMDHIRLKGSARPSKPVQTTYSLLQVLIYKGYLKACPSASFTDDWEIYESFHLVKKFDWEIYG